MSLQHTRFIHCADLHLDSRMESHLSQFQAQNRRKELLQTFSRMVSYAGQHEIKGILISGDLFDTTQISSTAVSTFLHCIQEYPQIDFLYLPGNHDSQGLFSVPYDMTWPDNLWFLQSAEVSDSGMPKVSQKVSSSMEDHPAHIHTAAQRNYGPITITGLTGPASSLPQLSVSQFNLVMLHGQIGIFESSCNSDSDCLHYPLKELSGKNIDYIAAGHIHQFQSGTIDSRGIYCYSGCLEGRGFDECGEKGFVFLDIITDDAANTSKLCFQFIPFASRQLFDLNADMTGISSYYDVEQQVEKILSDIDSSHLVRLKLCGRIIPDLNLHSDWLLRKYAEDFYFLHIEDCTRPIICYEDYRYDSSLKGEFIRLVLSAPDLEEKDREKIIMEGLRALSGEEILLNP